jgi:hypothetical protein
MLGDLPASATFPHQRDARKGRICATRFLFATTICCVLVLRRKLLSAQACASPSASRCKCYIGVGWIRLVLPRIDGRHLPGQRRSSRPTGGRHLRSIPRRSAGVRQSACLHGVPGQAVRVAPLLGPDLGLVVASRVEHRHTICAIKKAVEMSWKPVHILAFNSTSIGGTLCSSWAGKRQGDRQRSASKADCENFSTISTPSEPGLAWVQPQWPAPP